MMADRWTDQRSSGISGLELRTSQNTEGDVSRILAKLEATGQSFTVARIVANSPALFRGFIYLSDAILTRSRLPADLRELCILRLAALREAPYEWAEHVAISERAGVTDAQREAVATGRLGGFDSDRRAALALVEKLAHGVDWSAEDWREARERFGDDGAVELVLLAGFYGGLVPMLTRALGLVPEDAAEPTPEATR